MLIVEDEPYMADAIRNGLRLEAIAADIADNGDSALVLLSVNAYDIAVLDRDIPGPSGDDIARRIVASGSGMPILMLTAADRLDDKASGFGSAPTTTSRSRSNSGNSCSASEHSTAGAPTTGHPCESSPAFAWIRFAARSTATAATSRSPASSSPCSTCWSPPTAVSSAPNSCWNGRGMRRRPADERRPHHGFGPAQTPRRPWLIATVPGVGTASTQARTP